MLNEVFSFTICKLTYKLSSIWDKYIFYKFLKFRWSKFLNLLKFLILAFKIYIISLMDYLLYIYYNLINICHHFSLGTDLDVKWA